MKTILVIVTSLFLLVPSVAFAHGHHGHRGFYGHHSYHGYGHRHGFGFSIAVPYFNGYYGYYGRGYCSQWRREAIMTGSSYYWRRYYDCLD